MTEKQQKLLDKDGRTTEGPAAPPPPATLSLFWQEKKMRRFAVVQELSRCLLVPSSREKTMKHET